MKTQNSKITDNLQGLKDKIITTTNTFLSINLGLIGQTVELFINYKLYSTLSSQDGGFDNLRVENFQNDFWNGRVIIAYFIFDIFAMIIAKKHSKSTRLLLVLVYLIDLYLIINVYRFLDSTFMPFTNIKGMGRSSSGLNHHGHHSGGHGHHGLPSYNSIHGSSVGSPSAHAGNHGASHHSNYQYKSNLSSGTHGSGNGYVLNNNSLSSMGNSQNQNSYGTFLMCFQFWRILQILAIGQTIFQSLKVIKQYYSNRQKNKSVYKNLQNEKKVAPHSSEGVSAVTAAATTTTSSSTNQSEQSKTKNNANSQNSAAAASSSNSTTSNNGINKCDELLVNQISKKQQRNINKVRIQQENGNQENENENTNENQEREEDPEPEILMRFEPYENKQKNEKDTLPVPVKKSSTQSLGNDSVSSTEESDRKQKSVQSSSTNESSVYSDKSTPSFGEEDIFSHQDFTYNRIDELHRCHSSNGGNETTSEISNGDDECQRNSSLPHYNRNSYDGSQQNQSIKRIKSTLSSPRTQEEEELDEKEEIAPKQSTDFSINFILNQKNYQFQLNELKGFSDYEAEIALFCKEHSLTQVQEILIQISIAKAVLRRGNTSINFHLNNQFWLQTLNHNMNRYIQIRELF